MPDETPPVAPEILRLVTAACEIWAKRLLDKSRKNPLLFYRDLKAGTFDLEPHPKALTKLLDWKKISADDLKPSSAASTVPPTVSGSSAGLKYGKGERDPVRRRLRAIQRKAQSNLEEKGLETLYLALGMATWPVEDGGRDYDAPIVLIPVKCSIDGRGGKQVRLAIAGEPVLNAMLIFVLKEDHGVSFSSESLLSQHTSEDERDRWTIDHTALIEQVGQLAGRVREFQVSHRAILANFSFAKMAMMEDLQQNVAEVAKSEIVAAIAGHAESQGRLGDAGVSIEPRILDERPPQDDYLVLDADSTQHSAIVAAGKGQNLVIQGPPGTGKSQTIANLIAQSVADGRRVLFVAEKRAALDAVTKRLKEQDLGHLVLDLHGASVSRKEVMARVKDTLDRIRHTSMEIDEAAIHRDCTTSRKRLNEHAHRMNDPRSPVDLSLYEILGRLLQLPPEAESNVRFRDEVLTALTPPRVEKLRDLITEGAGDPGLLLLTSPSPWNNAKIFDGRTAQSVVDASGRVYRKLWPTFDRLFTTCVELAAFQRPPETRVEVNTLLKMLRIARRLLACFVPKFVVRLVLGCFGDWRQFAPGSDVDLVALPIRALDTAWTDLWTGLSPVQEVLRGDSFDNPVLWRRKPRSSRPLDLVTLIARLATDTRTPTVLPRIHKIRDMLLPVLGPFLEDLEKTRVSAADEPEDERKDEPVYKTEHWLSRLHHVWFISAYEAVRASDPKVASFKGRTHTTVVEKFRTRDREQLALAAARVRRCHVKLALEAMNNHPDQTLLVNQEALKKSRHLPLRKLLAQAPQVLTRVAPCWVASPLSVSQLLHREAGYFDLVIFDEASQILQEEAVPAIYRAGQIVVAGDRHQLPPTTFFSMGVDDVDEEEEEGTARTAIEAIGGFESLLDTVSVFLRNHMLQWHYRSMDERLIAFSNQHIYDRRLITFPSARNDEVLRHILIPHNASLGNQSSSPSGEVSAVVREVIEHARNRPTESLGVITMGITHANRVQAVLDQELESDNEFFDMEKAERFFVKNLENVQGDERDAIILTVGYGKTADGDLPHTFGPLTQEVGYRRLNVAVTRAKRRVTLVSSFTSDEVDLDRAGGRGVRLLKAYLSFAASGGTNLPPEETAGTVALNPFEADIKDALEAQNIKIRPQFGVSRYRIDLVAMHPEEQGRPVLAIECDGASYHSSQTARDRDRLRQQNLERQGWRFHRIWSTDWFNSREEEVQRAVTAYKKAVALADESRLPFADSVEPTGPRDEWSVLGEERAEAGVRNSTLKPWFGKSKRPIDRYSTYDLERLRDWVKSDGLNRTNKGIVDEMFKELPFKRMGSKIRQRLESIVMGS